MDRESLWQQTAPIHPDKTTLPAHADAVIIGGGLCGLLTAYELAKQGVSDIVVADSDEIAGGVTSHTTAKITAQHGFCYHRLRKQRGDDTASLYAIAAKQAEAALPYLIHTLSIDCGYTPCPSAIYATDQEGTEKIEQEAEALSHLHLPCSMDKNADLPFPITTALHMEGSGYFHPLQFTRGLIEHLQKQGVLFCPHTTAIDLTDDGVVTADGIIAADTVVMATHFPFRDLPGRYFMRMWQERSYVLATTGVSPPTEMYWGVGRSDPSLRPLPNGILIGGGNHRTGEAPPQPPFQKLEEDSARWYPHRQIAATWSAQDCMTPDGIPFIGRYPQADKKGMRVYVATGFNKWGMTNSMTAATILADSITGHPPEYAPIFAPSRLVADHKAFYMSNGKMMKHFLTGHLKPPSATLPDLKPGEGGLVTVGGKKMGGYRDAEGNLYLVKPTCTHMGCALTWNAAEASWDCPCHGSRFDYTGKPLNTPARKPLKGYKIPQSAHTNTIF